MSNKVPEQTSKLAAAQAPVRAMILKDLSYAEKVRVVDNLVESAMVMGLSDPYQIQEWLGADNIGIKSIKFALENVSKRWLEETADGYEYAQSQRAAQINKAWQEVRVCEKMFDSCKTVADQVKVKQLQLQWLQYVSKLSFVDKLIEAQSPDMQIIVNGGMSVEGMNE